MAMRNSDRERIKRAFIRNADFRRLLGSFNDICIIELDGAEPVASYELAEYMDDINVSRDVIKRIVLLGHRCTSTLVALSRLRRLFPSAKIETPNRLWSTVGSLGITSPFVIRFAPTIGYADSLQTELFDTDGDFAEIHEACNSFLEENKFLYSAELLYCKGSAPDFELSIDESLSDESIELNLFTKVIPLQCKKRKDDIASYKQNLASQDAFFQILAEAENGCDSCPQCSNYGPMHHCPLAQLEVARAYSEGFFVPQNEEIAHEWIRLAASQSYDNAIIPLANNLSKGVGCTADPVEAFKLYTYAAGNLGDQQAAKKIVNLAEAENDIAPNLAIPWIIKLANSGDSEMAFRLSEMLSEGSAVLLKDESAAQGYMEIAEENAGEELIKERIHKYEDAHEYQKAYEILLKLEKKNHLSVTWSWKKSIATKWMRQGVASPDVLYFKGNLHLHSSDADSLYLAEICLREAAKDGSIHAQETLCEQYYSGEKFRQSYRESVEWGRKALEQGSRKVRFRLAWLCADVEGVEPDYELSHRLYKELAKEGNAAAMNNLGCMCDRGHFYTVNPKKAFEWYQKSAEAGDDVGASNLAVCYRDGSGVEVDYEKAFYWFKIAASRGVISAMRNVAEAYREGKGVDKNVDAMLEWYDKAIQKGDAVSMRYLGYYYEVGEDIPQDHKRAFELYQKAAVKDDSISQCNLALAYQYGRGVDANLDTAIYWFRKSAKNGNERAVNILKELGCTINENDSPEEDN